MQSSIKKRAIVIGGGIGGVTAAIALQQAGIDVTVFEQAEELKEVGSGLPLWTNALRALYRLGLTNIVETIGESVTGGSISTWQGDILTELRAEDLLKKLGVINTVVHRAELLAMLLKALGEDKVQLGARCVGFTQHAALVAARFADGREVEGDVLIGADGLHSVIRSQLFGVTKPRYAGYACWRGLAHITGTGQTWTWGKGYQFGFTPMNHGRAYWWAQKYTPEGEHDKATGRKREVLELFHDWHDPIPAIIEATKETDILRNDIYESEPLRHWSHGRVTLLGDAAHTMTPNLGMGACQAIEDAAVLGACLTAEENIVAALKLYEKRRVRRANAIAFLARLLGQIVQVEHPGISNIRDAIMKKIPISTQLKRPVLWILDYEV